MPFTLSHAAAALPFRKLKPIWPALVMGTFAPDLQYFIWISDEDRSGHHFPGVLLLSLPLALVLLWLFETFVKGPAIELLPEGLQSRLQDKLAPLSFRGWKRFGSIVLWIVIGIATHIFWDWFTHAHTWITARWELFSYKLAVPFRDPMSVMKILQHVSTLLGLFVVVAWIVMWYLRTAPAAVTRVRRFSAVRKMIVVFTMVAIAAIVGYPLAIASLEDNPLARNPVVIIVTIFEAFTLVLCGQLLTYGLGRTITTRKRGGRSHRMHGRAASSRAAVRSE